MFPKPKPKVVDPIDALYKPALDAITAQRKAQGQRDAEAQKNLAAFRTWQTAQATANENTIGTQFQNLAAQRSAAVGTATANLAKFSEQARARLGLGADAQTSTGMDAAAAAGGEQMAGALTGTDFNTNIAQALAARTADNRRYDTALSSNLGTQLDFLKANKADQFNAQERELRMGIAKAKLQAKADAQTAAALAGQQAFENQLATDKLASSDANQAANRSLRERLAQQRLELDYTRLSDLNAWRASSLNIRNQKLKNAKNGAAKKIINDAYKFGVAQREAAQKALGKNPFGNPIQMSAAQKIKLIRDTATKVKTLNPDATPQQVFDALGMVWSRDDVALAGGIDWVTRSIVRLGRGALGSFLGN